MAGPVEPGHLPGGPLDSARHRTGGLSPVRCLVRDLEQFSFYPVAPLSTCDSPEMEPVGLGGQIWKRGGEPWRLAAMAPAVEEDRGYDVLSWAGRPDGCRC